MKFNWRANWEILLVLVIIVLGITITTITAIRNKDKQLLPLSEETDFGQLLADVGLPVLGAPSNGSVPLDESDDRDPAGQRRPLSQQQQQQQSGKQSGGRAHNAGYHHPAVRELQSSAGRLSNAHSDSSGRQSKYDENIATTIADQQQFGLLANQDRQSVDSHSPHLHNLQHPQQYHQHLQQPVQDLQDQYETLSTEPTPNQIRPDFASQALPSANQNSLMILHRHHPNLEQSRRQQQQQQQLLGNSNHSTGTNEQQQDAQQVGELFSDQLGNESVDLIDDIHTTRSSLANLDTSNGLNQQMIVNPHTLSSALHFGSLNHQLSQLLAHQQANNNHKQIEQQHPSSLLDSSGTEDMMTSYTRYPVVSANNSLLTDALLRDFALASSSGATPSNSTATIQQQQLLNSAMFANLLALGGNGANQSPTSQASGSQQQQQAHQAQSPAAPALIPPGSAQLDGAGELVFTPPGASMSASSGPSPQVIHHQRRFASSLPISMLISDLLKLARPSQQQNFSSSSLQADHKPQHGSILQQLRSLPGPLLNLLQGLSASTTGAGQVAGSMQQQQQQQQQHDASESNQHYHRISIPIETLAYSALARATPLSTILPAFPAPKGVPQTWVPATSGGSPNYHTAYNNNADFVASNVAGFVRSQQQVSAARADGDSVVSGPFSSQSSYPQQQQQQQQPQSQQQTSTNQQQQLPASGTQPSDSNYQQPAASDDSYQQAHRTSENIASQQQKQQQSGGQQSYQMQASQITPFKMLSPQPQVMKSSSADQLSHFASLGKQQQQVNAQQVAFMNSRLANKNFIRRPGSFQQPQQFNLPGSILAGPSQNPFLYSRQQAPEQSQQVPLGYNGNANGAPMMQHMMYHQQQSPFAAALEYNSANGVESAPKASVISATGTTAGSPAAPQVVAVRPSGMTLKRRKRSSGSSSLSVTGNQGNRSSPSGIPDQLMSSRYGGRNSMTSSTDEDEDDGDSRPISVVRPDGRPMNSGRVRGYSSDPHSGKSVDSQAAQSQRQANHLNLKPLTSNDNYDSEGDQQQDPEHEIERGFLPVLRNNLFRQNNNIQTQHENRQFARQPHTRSGSFKYSTGRNDKRARGKVESEAASGLMSKLLGTASTRDESEADEDPDEDDEANERRKEELEDAEFGIINERPGRSQQLDSPSLKLSGGSSSSSDSNSPGSSADSGNEAASYTPRRDQRPDIEFYGHPGEETRTLKYGILGSGNYEVVNGGVYTPEAEHESSAAVNSVAKYVRKPGALLAAKLLAEQQQQQQAAFGMPGSRLSGGFMRGASAHLDTEGLTMGHLFPGSLSGHKQLSSPLLELIDANGAQVFEANMLAHLGSSARTLHTSEPSEQQHQQQVASSHAHHRQQSSQSDPDELDQKRDLFLSNRNLKGASGTRGKSSSSDSSADGNEDIDGNVIGDENLELDSLENDEQKQQSRGGNKGQTSRVKQGRTNQFNSYQILPSKKVTIFSDQDLDSAPSETTYDTLTKLIPIDQLELTKDYKLISEPELENHETADEDYKRDYSG